MKRLIVDAEMTSVSPDLAAAPAAVIYARTSTDRQEREETVGSQIEACQAYCITNGIIGAANFIDDGVSGSDLRRPELARLRDLAKQGAVSTIVVYDVDRLSRSLFHLLLLIEEFEARGVELRFVRSPREDSAESRVLFHIKGVFAEYEREKIRERTLRGKVRYIREGGWFGLPPYGYRVVEQHLKVDPKEAPSLREMFSLYAAGTHTLQDLAVHLNACGVPTRCGRTNDHGWHPAVVGRILRRELYTGRFKRQIKAIPESACEVKVPPLIQASIWELVQARFKTNRANARRNRTHFYLLSGLVWCGSCGQKYYGRHQASAGTRYYRCATNHSRDRFPESCQGRGVRADSLEGAIWDYVVTRRRAVAGAQLGPTPTGDARRVAQTARLHLVNTRPEDRRALCQAVIQQIRIGRDRRVKVDWVIPAVDNSAERGEASQCSAFQLARSRLSPQARANAAVRSREAILRRIAAGLYVPLRRTRR